MVNLHTRRRITLVIAALLAVLLSGVVLATTEPPRREQVLPGLEPLDQLVDPSVPWYDQAKRGLERTRLSFVIIQNADHIGWPPLSGFIIGANHVVTAHLSELTSDTPPARFRIRFIDGQIREGVQVAGWRQHDFGVVALDQPIDLPPIEFADETTVSRGDPVLNIGNPNAVGRSGLAITSAGTFLRVEGAMSLFDISTLPGGSGGPVVNLDGALLGMASRGSGQAVTSIDEMTVSELRLRNSLPVDLDGAFGGVSASVLRRLTQEYQR